MIPDSFTLLPIPLPPMLLKMVGADMEHRFAGLYYQGTKATWTDGRSLRTFPFYTVWHPYIRHPAMLVALADLKVHLGSDDVEPTHQLICDQVEERVHVAPWREAQRFLDQQHPPLRSPSSEELKAIQALAAAMPQPSLEEMQQVGMFEWFLGSTPEMETGKQELVEWLNQFIDHSFIETYARMLGVSPEQARLFLEGRS